MLTFFETDKITPLEVVRYKIIPHSELERALQLAHHHLKPALFKEFQTPTTGTLPDDTNLIFQSHKTTPKGLFWTATTFNPSARIQE